MSPELSPYIQSSHVTSTFYSIPVGTWSPYAQSRSTETSERSLRDRTAQRRAVVCMRGSGVRRIPEASPRWRGARRSSRTFTVLPETTTALSHTPWLTPGLSKVLHLPHSSGLSLEAQGFYSRDSLLSSSSVHQSTPSFHCPYSRSQRLPSSKTYLWGKSRRSQASPDKRARMQERATGKLATNGGRASINTKDQRAGRVKYAWSMLSPLK